MTVLASSDLSPIETRSGPVLSDGVRLRDLIDFNKREVKLRVLTDPEIYRLELKRIFARSWMCLGHEAEIPNAGDFIKRAIGEDQVIVARGRDGTVSVFLNACAHRGMEICWADEGNQASFKCPYHGWVFDHSGNLLGAPFEKEMYGDWDKSQYGLRKARTELFLGRIYANFDADAEPLDEWLDEASFYLEYPYRGERPEMELVQGIRTYRVPANWKVPSGNNMGDGYHAFTLHESLAFMGMIGERTLDVLDTVKVLSEKHGHGMLGNKMSRDPAKRHSIDNMFFGGLVLFPSNFGIGGQNRRMSAPDGRSVVVEALGGAVPRGPGAYDLWTGFVVEKGAPPAIKDALLHTLMTIDIGQGDDYHAWASMTQVSKGVVGAEQSIRYNTIAGENKPADWPGPGVVQAGIGKDDNEWNFWRRWYDMMSIDEG